jgi:hypothetical protein
VVLRQDGRRVFWEGIVETVHHIEQVTRIDGTCVAWVEAIKEAIQQCVHIDR